MEGNAAPFPLSDEVGSRWFGKLTAKGEPESDAKGRKMSSFSSAGVSSISGCKACQAKAELAGPTEEDLGENSALLAQFGD